MTLTTEQQQERQQKLNDFRAKWESTVAPFHGKPNEEVPFSFAYKGNAADLACIEGTCGCTNVWIEGNEVKGILTLGQKSQYLNKAGQNGIAPESKNVMVYLADDKPFVIVSDKKLKQNNPEKVILNLTISGTVDVKE